VSAAEQPVIKCLVWDLDRTLWQGSLLEDGAVSLSDEVRSTIVELDSRGILQSVASRNDHDHAWGQLERFGIAEYFVLPQIGWGRKSDSIRVIADRLNFAQRTIAFIDDEPTERAEVSHELPEVRCYAATEALGLTTRPEFSPTTVTVDSRNRRLMCKAGFSRQEARARYRGPDEEFLRSLQLVLSIHDARDEDIARLEELTIRTSQMNATGLYYSEADLRALLADPAHDVLVASLRDRFGDHGAIGVLLLERQQPLWHLKLLATSCRVVSFGTGGTILRWVVNQAADAGVHLAADFRRTDRNRIMEIAYRFAGFAEPPCGACQPLLAAAPVQRLHLVPTPREVSSTMRVLGPDLREPRRPHVASSQEEIRHAKPSRHV
jgi:methoxymalonate biosynthesis protein